jgi:hypothetical protein
MAGFIGDDETAGMVPRSDLAGVVTAMITHKGRARALTRPSPARHPALRHDKDFADPWFADDPCRSARRCHAECPPRRRLTAHARSGRPGPLPDVSGAPYSRRRRSRRGRPPRHGAPGRGRHSARGRAPVRGRPQRVAGVVRADPGDGLHRGDARCLIRVAWFRGSPASLDATTALLAGPANTLAATRAGQEQESGHGADRAMRAAAATRGRSPRGAEGLRSI